MKSQHQLQKQFGFSNLFAISMGTMISSGFFVLPALAAAIAVPPEMLSQQANPVSTVGATLIAAFSLAGLLTIPALLSQAELATAMPKAGGPYFFLDRSMGSFAGTIGGIGTWLSLVFKSGFAQIGFGAYCALLMQQFGLEISIRWAAVFLCMALTLLNIAGSKKSGHFQSIMVMIVMLFLLIFLTFGIREIDPGKFLPFVPYKGESLIATTGLLFFSYAGFTKIASVAEETRNPDKNIPLAMLSSLVVVTLLYILGVLVILAVLPLEQLYKSFTPISDTAGLFMGKTGIYLMTATALLAFLSSSNAGLMSASRYPFAMARDHIFPSWLTKIGRTHTPYNAILVTSGVTLFFMLAFDIKNVAKLASAFQLMIFAFLNLAVIVMRESGIKDYHPGFKSPGYPWIQIVGILSSVLMITTLGMIHILFCVGVIVSGGLWYLMYASHRIQRVGAWVWLLERMVSSVPRNPALIHELRNIQKERGLQEGDPFDKMVLDAPFFEMKDEDGLESFIDRAIDHFEKRLGVDKATLRENFLNRRMLGETPVEAGVALPHIRLSGLDNFYLAMGRSQKGILVEGNADPVYAIFALVGEREHPALHLRILAELAVRADHNYFIEKWLQAENEEQIRILMLEKPNVQS